MTKSYRKITLYRKSILWKEKKKKKEFCFFFNLQRIFPWISYNWFLSVSIIELHVREKKSSVKKYLEVN